MDIGQGIKQSFNLYRKNFIVLLLSAWVIIICSVVTVGILFVPLAGGGLVLCRKLMRGEKTGINELFVHFNRLGPTFLLVLAMWAAMFISIVISFVPVLGRVFQFVVSPVISIVFVLAAGLAVERGLPPLFALKQVFRSFMTAPVTIWLYSLIIGFLSGSGALLLVLPIIFTMPLSLAGMAIAYQELTAKETDGTNVPITM